MVSATEGAGNNKLLSGLLDQGLDTLTQSAVVTFTKYLRMILPLDGFLFWVRSDLTETGATIETFEAKGSIHISVNHNQAEAESEGVSTIIFTAEEPIQQFTTIAPNEIWIGSYASDNEGFDAPIRFGFSARGPYFSQADLFHYTGQALLPAFTANIIDDPTKLSNIPQYVSNSLPVWLAISNYDPPYDNGINCHLLLYPSFLVPENIQPPYGVVHIEPTGTLGLQTAPFFDPTLGQYSLASDRVRVTLYGLSNDQAMMFLAAVLQYSYDYNTIGMLNIPTIRDEKRIQPELSLVALKKSIEFEVSYNQTSMRDIARQQIQNLIPQYYPQPLTAVGFWPPAP